VLSEVSTVAGTDQYADVIDESEAMELYPEAFLEAGK
jgi:hypothetical protein